VLDAATAHSDHLLDRPPPLDRGGFLLYDDYSSNKPMGKSKFFTDCTNHHTFSLDHVVAISKHTRASGRLPFDILGYQIKITLLICDKEKQDLRITFLPDKEDERDAEFKRLCKALYKNNS